MDFNFEKALGDFIERQEYDHAETALFSMVRISFLAGWQATGGNPPKPQKIIEIHKKTPIEKENILFNGCFLLIKFYRVTSL